MSYRTGTEDLLTTLQAWDRVMPDRGKVCLIACGGTALTLLGYKESTKDVDFLVPSRKEYDRLVKFLEAAGYLKITEFGWKRVGESILYDVYPGKRVYSTELLTSPLEKGGHKKFRAWKKIYLGVLNTIDLMITKLFRGHQSDFDDCTALMKNEAVNIKAFKKRFMETASYDTSEAKALKNLELFLNLIGRRTRK